MSEIECDRRSVLGGMALVGLAAMLGGPRSALAATAPASVARPAKGFVPLNLPGRVVKAHAKGDFASAMHKNQIWPKPEVARRLLEKALMELTGAPNLGDAMRRFVHADDVVAIKTNGIAGNSMATSFELVLPVVEACILAGVAPERITVFEQYPTYLLASRVGAPKFDLPKGIRIATHNNQDHPMSSIAIYQGISTKFCRQLTEATAVINMGLVKDHGICGYTGALKNITHGTINNPEAHHAHYANPQIAMLYAHPIVTSRVRLHIADAFRVMSDGGPLYKNPQAVVPHGAVYVATDPVALDTVGWMAVDEARKQRGRPNLGAAGRAPRYIETASELGLGVRDLNQLRLSTHEV